MLLAKFIFCRLDETLLYEATIGLTKSAELCGTSYNDLDLDCRRRGWTWTDGTTYNYPQFHDWQDDDPDPDPVELCARLYQSGTTSGWYGHQCEGHSANFAYICEKGN